ncbi:MAG TPA: hypothetical protein VKE40_12545 [Gemmataceae bacterium]|nr:hypothetical protein [Gemmataceae bacterium]
MSPLLFAQAQSAPSLNPGQKTGVELFYILIVTALVLAAGAIVIKIGASRGHIVLGIIGGLCSAGAVAVSSFLFAANPLLYFLACGGLPVAIVFGMIIKFLPTPKNQPLLTRAEIEAETRRARGF